jgi:integrase/recombinase XerD
MSATSLQAYVDDYLRLRRGLGFKLERAGQILPQFVSYLEAAGASTVTRELAISWAKLPASARPQHWAARLAIARGFAAYLQTIDPATEVPPAGVFAVRYERPTPYLWSESDIRRLLEAARGLIPSLKAASYEALFGLLAVSGMRVGEAVALGRDDVDLDAGLIIIREQIAKLEKARPWFPLHPTTVDALDRYATKRDRLCPTPRSTRYFISSIGTALTRSEVAKTLRKLTTMLGLRTDTVHPVAHQLRHTFAVRTLVDWQRSGVPIDERIVLLSTYLGHVSPAESYWYLTATPELMGPRPARPTVRSTLMSLLAPSLQAFFTDRLLTQRQASPNTIAAYRHTFQLLLRFATDRTGTPPSELDITQLDAPLIASFLEHLEHDRHNTIQTPNNRLAAIHSLFAYLALHHPEHANTIQRVLAIPHKRTTKNLLTYLTEPEVDTLLAACDQSTWTGRRDHAMLALTIQTGLRISELVALTRQDITLGTGANVHTIGKRRKARRTPLTPPIRTILAAWPKERAGNPGDPLFPSRTGTQLSRDTIEHRLAHHLAAAARDRPSLTNKHITMHTLRHTAAMRLLLAGNDITVIALWLGHEQITTTNIYLHANMTHKQKALDRTKPIAAKPGRYRPTDSLLAFLEAL